MPDNRLRYFLTKTFKDEYLSRQAKHNIMKYVPWFWKKCMEYADDQFYMAPEWSVTGRFHIHVDILFKSNWHRNKFFSIMELKGKLNKQVAKGSFDQRMKYLEKDYQTFRDHLVNDLEVDLDNFELSKTLMNDDHLIIQYICNYRNHKINPLDFKKEE